MQRREEKNSRILKSVEALPTYGIKSKLEELGKAQ